MCDRKYICQKEGLKDIQQFLLNLHPIDTETQLICKEPVLTTSDINTVQEILATMSYSTVKKNGFPTLGGHQKAYHIVREADLLAGYDFDRSMIYHIHNTNSKRDINEAFKNSEDLFKNRVFRHNVDGLFVNEFSKHLSLQLHSKAIMRMDAWRRILKNNPVQ